MTIEESTCGDAVNREAITEHLKSIAETIDVKEIGGDYNTGFYDGLEFAIDFVITLPSVKPCEDIDKKADEYEKAFMEGFEAHRDLVNKSSKPCEDCVSRAEALRINMVCGTAERKDEELRKLPSVQPTQPCGDCVSRETVIDYIRDNYRRWFINDDAFMQCVNGIKDMNDERR